MRKTRRSPVAGGSHCGDERPPTTLHTAQHPPKGLMANSFGNSMQRKGSHP